MGNWSLNILRQGGFDLWVWVCVVAAVVLATYAARGAVRSWMPAAMAGVGVAGTVLVVVMPSLHRPAVGLVWTLLLLSILSAVFYATLRSQLSRGQTATLLAMRILAIGLLVPMLFEPVLRYVARRAPDKPLIFLIDTSGSMSFPDVTNGPTRLQSVWQALRPQLPRVGEHFVPTFFTFSTQADPLKDPDDLANAPADGKATDIVSAVATALGRITRDDANVVLISDGIDNVSADVAAAVGSSLRPIHTVRVGSDQAEPATMANVAIDNIDTGDDFVVNHESKIKAVVKSTALANRVVDVKLSEIDDAGKPVGETTSRKLVLQPLAEGQTVELPFRATSVGVKRVAVWIDPVVGERSTVDNRQEFQGLAIDPRIKVLYVEGRARPEYRELSRALARDGNIESATLLRIQNERFAAAGTVDGEPFKAMPTSLDQWKKLDVIILGDLDSSFLTRQQQEAIEKFVSDGGGLLMIGGQNNFGPGGYQGSPVELALPVFAGEKDASQEKREFVPRMTGDGQTHPATDGLAAWFGVDDKAGEKQLPPLRGNVVVGKAKSGAQVLLTHRDRPSVADPNSQIVLATQNYGRGRSAAFTVDTTYLWYLPLRGLGQDSPYNRLWGQLVRWLAGQDVRNRGRGSGVDALLSKNLFQLGENVRVRVMVRDERGDATRFAQVNLVLKPTVGQSKQWPMTPMDSRAGMYEIVLPSPAKGEYSAELIATKDGKELGKHGLKFTVVPPADEMLKLAANPLLLGAIADRTHGLHVDLAQLPTLIDELIRSDPAAGKSDQRSVPLSNFVRAGIAMTGGDPQWPRRYDLPTQGLLVILLLCGEWILRRRWQLA